jgi:hypothetical protein
MQELRRICKPLLNIRNNGSDGRIGGRTAVTTFSIWFEKKDTRVGLLRVQDLLDCYRGWGLLRWLLT